jgi:hypothetical protein
MDVVGRRSLLGLDGKFEVAVGTGGRSGLFKVQGLNVE